MNKTVKLGKNGGAKRIANELSKIRKTPLSNEVFEIVESSNNKKQADKKSAKPATDLGV